MAGVNKCNLAFVTSFQNKYTDFKIQLCHKNESSWLQAILYSTAE
jgi:hypothetical protein